MTGRDAHAAVVVVGGGIVGLATAMQILRTRPGTRLVVLERAPQVGTGQSARNSGVVHAGLYYPPGSAKARWCRAGRAAYLRFAQEQGVPVEMTGKVVAAVERREIPRLRALVDRARTNGVEITELDAHGVHEHEPHVHAVAGAWTPETAVTDFRAAAVRMAELVEEAGGQVRTGVEVTRIEEREHQARIHTTGDDLSADVVVSCAGLAADRVAAAADARPRERIVPFRGAWLRLRDELSHLVRGNIYPVPLPGLPFLGVHLTRRIDGQVWIGPNAVLALAREGDRPWSVNLRDLRDTLAFPGTWRLAARNLGTALGELTRDRWIAANLRQIRRYVPDISADDLERGPWGVRAQLVDRSGRMVDDFVVRDSARVVHVLNAPSPAATASLAIGAELRDRALQRIGA